MLWYLRIPLQPPLSACWGVTVSPSGVPVTGAQNWGGVQERGLNDPPPPPPARKPISPQASLEQPCTEQRPVASYTVKWEHSESTTSSMEKQSVVAAAAAAAAAAEGKPLQVCWV